MVGAVDAEETGLERLPGDQVIRSVLQHRQRVLVLKPGAGQPIGQQPRRRGPSQPGAPDDLQRVRGPGDRLAQAPQDHPRHELCGHVLAYGERGPVVAGLDRSQVEVLGDVVLVGPHVLVCGQGHVLGVDHVHGDRFRAVVGDLDVPEPRRVVLGQPEPDPEPQPAPVAADVRPRVGPTHRARARGPQHGGHRDPGGQVNAQEQVGGTGLDVVGRVRQHAAVAHIEATQGGALRELSTHPCGRTEHSRER